MDSPANFYTSNFIGNLGSPQELKFPQLEAGVVALTYKVKTDLRVQFEGQSDNKSTAVECLRELLRSGRYILLVADAGSSSFYE